MSERSDKPATGNAFEFDALRHAVNYRQALLREFGPFLKGRVIEIGAGIGQMTGLLVRHAGVTEVAAIEPEGDFCRQLRQNLPGQRVIQGTIEALQGETGWQAILSVNVLEHIQDDERELRRYYELLRGRQGALCLFVPAGPELYAPLDRDFGHHRRYTKPDLRYKIEQAGFTVVRLDYFNWVSYFAWWFSFRLLKKRRFEPGAVKFFDRIIFPVVHGLESRFRRPPFGQSLLAVGQAGAAPVPPGAAGSPVPNRQGAGFPLRLPQ